jgi:hypothetical protein
MSAERSDYRIIARARAPDRSSRRTLAPNAWPLPNASEHARDTCAQQRSMRGLIPALSIFSGGLRRSIWLVRAYVLVLAQPLLSASDSAKGGRLRSASVPNRNGARARRNRIFLHRRHHIFVVQTLRTWALARESPRESRDSARLIRLGVRGRAASSGPRSPLADWLCRRSTSSPDPRTNPTSRASFSPAPPCRDWPQ